MSVLGLRASAQEVRYAIIEKDDFGNIKFVNIDGENRLKYPSDLESVEDKLDWVKQEICRIIRQNPSIEEIAIKMNEYAGSETSSKRETNYVDAVFLLCARENNIPVVRKINSQINSNSARAKEYAENRVGRTEHYWNNTIADAILVAYKELSK